MRTAYLDCAAGISGDMCLGALVDAGASFAKMKRELRKVPLPGYTISSRKVSRAGISATKVDVRIKSLEVRKWKDIQTIIRKSGLSENTKDKGLSIFKRIFEAEAKVHGKAFDMVHLHELGAVDCIVDIFGTLIGLELLGIEKIISSPVNLGNGIVQTAHGILPVPAPATIELLKERLVYSSEIPFELTTPTGAVLIRELTSSQASIPLMAVDKIGYGAGGRELEEMPNVLRIMIGDEYKAADGLSPSTDNSVVVLETNIDDMNPQYYESVMGRLFDAGALDVFLENIIMKKGRPAIKLTAIILDNDIDRASDILFKETTTIGLRLHRTERRILDREVKRIKTRYGFVRFKISSYKGKVVTASPEYEDIRAISEKKNIPIRVIAKELSVIKP
jgi:pyridinium-3,5-bisthiocarboxylic acid mononucleotide nickel chelatase